MRESKTFIRNELVKKEREIRKYFRVIKNQNKTQILKYTDSAKTQLR